MREVGIRNIGQVQLTDIKKELSLIVLSDQGREKKQILINTMYKLHYAKMISAMEKYKAG